MSSRNNKTNKRNKSLILKATFAFMVVIAVGFSAMVFAFNSQNKGEETYKQNLLDEEQSTEVSSILSKNDDMKIYKNIFINNIDVGDMTTEEAEKELKEKLSSKFDTLNITLSTDDNSYTIPYKNINVAYDTAEAIKQAYEYGRSDDKAKNKKDIKSLKDNELNIEMKIIYDNDLLKAEIAKIGEQVNIPALEPTFKRIDGEFSIGKEQYGKKIIEDDILKQADEIIKNNKTGNITLAFEEVAPKYTAADFSKATDLIGTFTTKFSAGDNARNTNIKTAANKINDIIVLPGEVFSTNKAFGAMTYDNGYRPAATIVNGKFEDDFGGGVCQVSSTLYNAVLFSELAVVERQNHSLKVGYTDWGFDATLAGDYIDFKFKNDTLYPVTVESYTTSNSVVVNIYGHEEHDKGRKLVFENALVKTNPPAAEAVTEDPNLPMGERVEEIKPRTGYVYNVYKLVYENGKLVDKVKVNTSSYRATRGEVRVGIGPGAKPSPTPEVVNTEVPVATPTATTAPEPTTAPTENVTPSSPDVEITPVPTQSPDISAQDIPTETVVNSEADDSSPIIDEGPIME